MYIKGKDKETFERRGERGHVKDTSMMWGEK